MNSEFSHPWDRLPDEPGRWYERFLVYVDLKGDRSINRAYLEWNRRNPPKSAKPRPEVPGGAWYKAAKDWNWEQRAFAHDYHERQIEEQEIRELKLNRKKQLLEEEWEWREELLSKVRQMLNTPIHHVRTTDAQGRQVTVTPARWTFRTVVDFLNAASQLGRLSLEMDQKMHPELEALAVLANSGMAPVESTEIVADGLNDIVERLQQYNAKTLTMATLGKEQLNSYLQAESSEADDDSEMD